MVKKYHVDLSVSEQEELKSIINSRTQTSEVVKRSYILLGADRNGEKKWTDSEICAAYEVKQRTVERIRQRFVEDGFSTVLKGKERLYKKERKFDGKVEAQLISLRCSEPSEVVAGRSAWTLRLLSDTMVELGYVEDISHEQVRQILKKTKLSLGK
jgi:DNA-directed RNA polymerase sigma subunit (sigma70/sigma32)